MQRKIVIPGRVERLDQRRFKIQKDRPTEPDVTIDIVDNKIVEDGGYEVEKLSLEGMPEKMEDDTPIRWFSNFAVKKAGKYINQRYSVTIPGLSSSNVVILDRQGNLYYYQGKVVNDTIELTDGDPGVGIAP